jgi:glycyl-tRNA synthetase
MDQPATNKEESKDRFEEIVSYLKMRGFIFPSSEIYGGMAGIYDYGHYGYLLAQNVKDAWMKSMIQERDDIVALDSAIFMHPTTWKASGHVDGFNDPQIDCRKCKSRFRADHILEDFGINADKQSIEFVNAELDKLRVEKKLTCSNCKSADLTEARVFSLMVKSNLGSPVDMLTDENVVYLRPETCGGIYLEYKNTVDSLHPKLPFGIAQVGKAFRNEIAAKQYIFRTREFEQMEMQYFFNPKGDDNNATKNIFEAWHKTRWEFYLDYGIDAKNLNWHKHEKLAHYASDAYDIEYNYSMLGGFKELEGVHARGDWDLSQHSKFSGVDLSYFDEATKERFTPHIVETSVGVARMMLAFIDQAYTTEKVGDDERVVLKLDKRLSPIKIAVLPLSKKEPLQAKAQEIISTLRKNWMCEYDETQSVGKRYRRNDEIGTPYCVTVDFDTLDSASENFDSVTVRDRDTMLQERIKISDLKAYFAEKLA